MTHYFYAHLVNQDDIHNSLDILDVTEDEKTHLKLIIESSMHHVVVDAVLTKLQDNQIKQTFLAHIADENHAAVWEILNAHLPEAEEIIRLAVDDLQKELAHDVKVTRLQ